MLNQIKGFQELDCRTSNGDRGQTKTVLVFHGRAACTGGVHRRFVEIPRAVRVRVYSLYLIATSPVANRKPQAFPWFSTLLHACRRPITDRIQIQDLSGVVCEDPPKIHQKLIEDPPRILL